jgi:collagenase-like PrtC family protease
MNIEKLIVGIDDNTDIDLLLQKGLRQFYFGYVPPKFIEKFGHSASLNRRNNIKEQFLNLEKLSNTIDKIHTKKGIVYLTLNPMVSNNTLLKYSKEVFELLKNSVDGIIVSTITLAVFLKNLGYKKIVVSNLFGNYSKDAVSFLIKQFKPIKIILPRDMRLEDIANIVNAFPSQEFECFLFGDGCRFSESFCFIDQGEYELSSQTLCSYATYNNKIVKKATPSFKMIVTDGTLYDLIFLYCSKNSKVFFRE